MRVGIVEDEPDLARLFCFQLTAMDHEPVLIGDGAAALEWDGWDRIDAVLVDLMMPEVGGELVLTFLKEAAPHVRRVVLSAAGGARLAHVTALGLADAVLPKPSTSDVIERALHDG